MVLEKIFFLGQSQTRTAYGYHGNGGVAHTNSFKNGKINCSIVIRIPIACKVFIKSQLKCRRRYTCKSFLANVLDETYNVPQKGKGA
jgi:hypothetical protein